MCVARDGTKYELARDAQGRPSIRKAGEQNLQAAAQRPGFIGMLAQRWTQRLLASKNTKAPSPSTPTPSNAAPAPAAALRVGG